MRKLLYFCTIFLVVFSAAFFLVGCSEKLGVVGEVERTTPQLYEGDGGVYPTLENPLIAATKDTSGNILAQNDNERIQQLKLESDSFFGIDTDSGEKLLLKAIADKSLKKHFLADAMYGEIPNSAKRVVKNIRIDGRLSGQHLTGLYAAAGEIITITIPESLKGKSTIYIAPNASDIYMPDETDELERISQGHDLVRMPQVKYAFALENTVTQFGTPFGGLITFFTEGETFDEVAKSDFTITISGAVETPYYELGKTTKKQWEQIRQNAGKAVHFTTQNLSIIFWNRDGILDKLDEPEQVLRYWQSVLAMQDSITHNSKIRTRRMTCYFDDYLFAQGVSAYATVPSELNNFLQSDAARFIDYDYCAQNGFWEVFHQFGHHHQDYMDYSWTLNKAIDMDVTANIMAIISQTEYSSVAYNRLDDENFTKGYGWASDYYSVIQAAKNLGEANDYLQLSEDVRLSMYAILYHRFGLKGMQELFSTYPKVTRDEGESDESLEKRKRDTLLIHSSKTLKYDFRQFFNYFKLNNSIDAGVEVAKLLYPEFYPIASLYGGTKLAVTNTTAYELDFEKNTISLYGEIEVKKVSISGNNNVWTKKEGFLYSLNAVFKGKKVGTADKITIEVKTPHQTVQIIGSLQSLSEKTSALLKFNEYKPYDGKGFKYNENRIEQRVVAVKLISAAVISVIVGVVLGAGIYVFLVFAKRKKDSLKKSN